MNYRYRVKGMTEKAFILRGMYFRVGSPIDTQILDSELSFIKERCKLDEIVDMATLSQPIPTNSTISKKGVTNELRKSTSRTNQNTSKAKVCVD